MHSGGLTRFARGLLSIPSCCRDNIPAPLEGLQYIWAQRCFSTSATPSTPPSTPTTSAAPADNAATSQQNQPDTKDAARLEYEDEMRKLRRKWQGQHAQKLAIKAKAEATKTANKAVTIEGHRRKKAEMKELRMQIHEERRRLQSAELVSLGFLALFACCFALPWSRQACCACNARPYTSLQRNAKFTMKHPCHLVSCQLTVTETASQKGGA